MNVWEFIILLAIRNLHSMNATQFLFNFADKIEQKEIVNQSTAIRIRSYVRKLEDSTPVELFLIVSGIMGALFCAAGIFSLIGHNWEDYPKYVRGMLGIVPALVALYFYYRAIFHHPTSKPWIEVSSVFLMLMIGASLALVGNTYQLDGDYIQFIKLWAVLTLPLFYFARASGITILYLGLISALAVSINFDIFGLPSIGQNDHVMWYWLLFIGFAPHYVMSLNKKSRSQSIRITYMSYVLYLSVANVLSVSVEGNFVLWVTTIGAGFYLIGKRFTGENPNIFARPFQALGQLSIVSWLVFLSSTTNLNRVFGYDSFILLFKDQGGPLPKTLLETQSSNDRLLYFIIFTVLLAIMYFTYFYFKKQLKDVSKLILFTPAFLLIMMIFHEFVFPDWFVALLINGWVLLIGFNAMITGNENQNIAQLVFGFLLISILLWFRYYDTGWNFIAKGLIFLAIGGGFFLLNLIQKSKLERIERNKTRRDDC